MKHSSRHRRRTNNRVPSRRSSDPADQNTSQPHRRHNPSGLMLVEESNDVKVIPIKNSFVGNLDNPITSGKYLYRSTESATTNLAPSLVAHLCATDKTIHLQAVDMTPKAVIEKHRASHTRWHRSSRATQVKPRRAREVLLVCRTYMLLLALSLIVRPIEGKSCARI